MARARRGTWFDPALVDALLSFEYDAVFWDGLRRRDARARVAALEPKDRILVVDSVRTRPRRRGVRAGHRRQVALHGDGTRRRRPHRDRDRAGAWACSRRGARAPPPRGAAARHRQARRLQPDPRQARQARRGRGGGRCGSTRGTPSRSSGGCVPSATWRQWPRGTTNGIGWTGLSQWPATATSSAGSTGCWRWPMSARRSRPSGPTARRCRRRKCGGSFAAEAGKALCPEAIEALEGVGIRSEQRERERETRIGGILSGALAVVTSSVSRSRFSSRSYLPRNCRT